MSGNRAEVNAWGGRVSAWSGKTPRPPLPAWALAPDVDVFELNEREWRAELEHAVATNQVPASWLDG